MAIARVQTCRAPQRPAPVPCCDSWSIETGNILLILVVMLAAAAVPAAQVTPAVLVRGERWSIDSGYPGSTETRHGITVGFDDGRGLTTSVTVAGSVALLPQSETKAQRGRTRIVGRVSSGAAPRHWSIGAQYAVRRPG